LLVFNVKSYFFHFHSHPIPNNTTLRIETNFGIFFPIKEFLFIKKPFSSNWDEGEKAEMNWGKGKAHRFLYSDAG